MKSRFLLVIVALLIALPLSAVVYRVPSDETLIRASHSAVVGTVVASETRVARTGGFETVFTIAVQESLKGENGETIRVVVPGGRIGTRFHVIPGAPDVQTGDRLLLLTTRRNDGALTPLGFGLGVFHFATSNRGTSVLTRSIDGVL